MTTEIYEDNDVHIISLFRNGVKTYYISLNGDFNVEIHNHKAEFKALIKRQRDR